MMNSWQSAGPLCGAPQASPQLNTTLENPVMPAAAQPAASRARVWAHRIGLVIYVAISIWVGMVLLLVPWSRLWTDNGLLLHNLTLRAFALNGFVRGAISGLGLINLWLAIWEGVHYHDPAASGRN